MFNFIDGVTADGQFEKIKCPDCKRTFYALALSNMSQKLVAITSNVQNEILIVKMNEYESRISYLNGVKECLKRIRKETDRMDLSYPEISGRNTYVCIYCNERYASVSKQMNLDEFLKKEWTVNYRYEEQENNNQDGEE